MPKFFLQFEKNFLLGVEKTGKMEYNILVIISQRNEKENIILSFKTTANDENKNKIFELQTNVEEKQFNHYVKKKTTIHSLKLHLL